MCFITINRSVYNKKTNDETNVSVFKKKIRSSKKYTAIVFVLIVSYVHDFLNSKFDSNFMPLFRNIANYTWLLLYIFEFTIVSRCIPLIMLLYNPDIWFKMLWIELSHAYWCICLDKLYTPRLKHQFVIIRFVTN